MSKIILWDFDGTLAFHESGDWEDLFYMLFDKSELNNNLSAKEITQALDKSLPWNNSDYQHPTFYDTESWIVYVSENFRKNLNITENQFIPFLKLFNNIMDEYLNLSSWHLFSETLMVLQKTNKLGFNNIIISNHIPDIYNFVEYLGLDKNISKIFCSSEIGWEKPNKAFFEFIFKNIKKESIKYFIGNSYSSDYIGALNSDLPFLSVRKKIPNYENCFLNLEEVYDYIEKTTPNILYK